ncbi:hypothetical protein, partial [Crocosphaera sp. Alani8]|uniref:hypothetical protein n=1 Tax=Crocosphaera sp. Alani8 TaxID=3038952 RepID=UPI00313AA888
MFSLDFSNIEIQKTLLSGIFSTVNTFLAVLVANCISQKLANRKKLQEKLQQAIKDIEFLLQVEKAHCEKKLLKKSGGTRRKLGDK